MRTDGSNPSILKRLEEKRIEDLKKNQQANDFNTQQKILEEFGKYNALQESLQAPRESFVTGPATIKSFLEQVMTNMRLTFTELEEMSNYINHIQGFPPIEFQDVNNNPETIFEASEILQIYSDRLKEYARILTERLATITR